MAPYLLAALIIFLGVIQGPASANEVSEFERARSAAASGDLFEAQSLLSDFIENRPKSSRVVEARFLLGRIFYRRADHASAAEQFSEIMRTHPGWKRADEAVFGLAMARLGMVDYFAAAEALDTMLESYPDSASRPDAQY